MKRIIPILVVALAIQTTAYAQNLPQTPQNTFPTGAQLFEAIEIPSDIEYIPGSGGMAVINSISNGFWNEPGTWDCGCIPGELDDVIVSAGDTVTLNMDANITSLTIQDTGSFRLESDGTHTMTFTGDWTTDGEFIPENGTLVISGSADQNIVGPTEVYNMVLVGGQNVNIVTEVRVTNVLSIDGATLIPNDRLTLAATGSKTASLDKITNGQILGSIVVEKEISATNNGWITISAPLMAGTIEEWNDDFLTTGFIGADYPGYNFQSIQYYDETNTEEPFVGIDSATQEIVTGLGYYVYANAGTYPVETVGQPVIGAHNLPVTFTPTGDVTKEGLNVLGNPYASDINWDNEAGWNKQNVNGALHVWDVSQNQFRAYNNGYGVNGGTSLIRSCEAFWVQANGSNPLLNINEEAKVIDWTPEVNTSNDFIRIAMSGTETTDELIVAFNDGALLDYEALNDAFKFFSSGDTPNIATRSADDQNLSINVVELGGGGFDIPVVIRAPEGGDFTLGVLDFPQLETMACMALEDLLTGEMYELSEGTLISFSTTPVEDQEVRFVIHVGETIYAESFDVLCNGGLEGSAVAQGTGSGPWDIVWTDADENVLASYEDVSDLITLGGLGAGSYTVTITNNDYCDNLSKTVTITEPDSMYLVDDMVMHIDCGETNSGEIIVLADGGTGALSYDWSHGASGSGVGDLTAGTYTVTISDENGCTLEQEYEVTAAPTVEAFFDADSQVIDLIDGSANISFDNQSTNATSFSWDFGDGSDPSTQENPSHTYTAAGVYVVSLTASNDECEGEYQIVIQVQEVTTGIEETSFTEGITLVHENGNLMLNFRLMAPTQVEINGFNTLGQQLIEPISGSFQNERIELQFNHKVPVCIITVTNRATTESKSFKILNQ